MSKVATNYDEWKARQDEMRSAEDFRRAPYGAEGFVPYSTADPRVPTTYDCDYTDDDRDDMTHVGLFGKSPLDEDYERGGWGQ